VGEVSKACCRTSFSDNNFCKTLLRKTSGLFASAATLAETGAVEASDITSGHDPLHGVNPRRLPQV
jgi:hypothetical protein